MHLASLLQRPAIACNALLSEQETQKILESGSNCLDTECAVDDVASLLFDLKDQEKLLSSRLNAITKMLEDLEEANKKTKVEERDEVKMFVRDLLWVFSHDVS